MEIQKNYWNFFFRSKSHKALENWSTWEKKTKCVEKNEQETKIKSTEIKKEMHKLEKKIGLFSFSRISVVSIKLVKTFTH